MIFIERYPLKRCQGCVKLIASKVNCFLNITDLSEVQLCMSSNSWTWECPHIKDGADHVPLIFLSSVLFYHLELFLKDDSNQIAHDSEELKGRYNIGNVGKIVFTRTLTLFESRYTFNNQPVKFSV